MVHRIIEVFASLPDTSKTAILASTIASIVTFAGTLVGVIVANRGHERRLQRQLAHDKEQKKTDREMLLRKEVYLKAAEAVMAGVSAVGRHADPAIPQNKLAQEISEMGSALGKVHLIGSSETLTATSKFSVEIVSTILELTLGRLPLLEKQTLLKVMDEQIRNYGRERDRMVDLMKQLNLEGDHDPKRWDFLQRMFDFEQKLVNDTLAEQAKLRAEFQKEWMPYRQRCYDASTRLARLLVPAVKAIRQELDLPFDAHSYQELVEDSVRRQRQALDDFFRGVQEREAKEASQE